MLSHHLLIGVHPLRHGEVFQIGIVAGVIRLLPTSELYTDEDLDEMIAAQEKLLDAVGFESGIVQ